MATVNYYIMNGKIIFTTLTIFVVSVVALVFIKDFKNRRDAKTVYVGPTKVLCLSNRLQRCYQIKENENDDYKLFNGTIRNFSYVPGYEYKLLVDEVTVENINNGQKFVTYDLYKQVEKKEVPYVLTVTPNDGQVLPINRSFTVAGKARGVYEGNIVIEAKDLKGNLLARVPTTMPTDKPGAESVWQAQLSVNTKPGTKALIVAYSPSPANESETKKTDENKNNEQDTQKKDENNNQDAQKATVNPLSYSTIVVFDPKAKAIPVQTSLENTSWLLKSYKTPNGTEIKQASQTTPVTATFLNGKIGGTSGCNNYQASYETKGDTITVGPIASTRKACEDNVNKLENDYQLSLQSVAYYQAQPTSLILYNSQRVPLLEYTRVIRRKQTPNQDQNTSDQQDANKENTDDNTQQSEDMNNDKQDTNKQTDQEKTDQNTNDQQQN